MMPHPERSFIRWQLGYDINESQIYRDQNMQFSAWMGLVCNAYSYLK